MKRTMSEYTKMSVSVENGTADRIDEIASEFGIPKSCVINIAVSRPDKFKRLVKAVDKEIQDSEVEKQEAPEPEETVTLSEEPVTLKEPAAKESKKAKERGLFSCYSED